MQSKEEFITACLRVFHSFDPEWDQEDEEIQLARVFWGEVYDLINTEKYKLMIKFAEWVQTEYSAREFLKQWTEREYFNEE